MYPLRSGVAADARSVARVPKRSIVATKANVAFTGDTDDLLFAAIIISKFDLFLKRFKILSLLTLSSFFGRRRRTNERTAVVVVVEVVDSVYTM